MTARCRAGFDRVIVLDWSAANRPKRGADSIWIGEAGTRAAAPLNLPTRAAAQAELEARIAAALHGGESLLIGADFPFGYPAGFAARITGQAGALSLWAWLAQHLTDSACNRSDRFALAAGLNARLPGIGPFWGRPALLDLPGLPARGTDRHGHGLPDKRLADERAKGAQSVWKLFTTGSVGSQALTGIPRLQALRHAFPGQVAVWPFEAIDAAPVVLAEVFPSLLAEQVAAVARRYACKDAAQVDLLAHALHRLGSSIAPLLTPDAPPGVLLDEGWILGLGHEAALRAAAATPAPAPDRSGA